MSECFYVVEDAARLVDELTTLLYDVLKRWEANGRMQEIVQCGACRRKADKPESVVHDSDCPVYRLQRAEAVIKANAKEIADLEDARDDKEEELVSIWSAAGAPEGLSPLQAVERLCFEIERERQSYADLVMATTERVDELSAQLDAERARAEAAEAQLAEIGKVVDWVADDAKRDTLAKAVGFWMEELRHWEQEIPRCTKQIEETTKRAEAAEAREARLREAGEMLSTLARHRSCCAGLRGGVCDCGLREARAALAGTPEGEL